MTPEQRLDLWLSEEREVVELLNSGPGVGVARPAQLVGKSGLEVMHAMMNGQLPYAEFAKHLTFYAIVARPGSAVFQGTPQREYLNPMGTIHGKNNFPVAAWPDCNIRCNIRGNILRFYRT